MKAYTMNAVTEFIQSNSDNINEVKVTKVVTNGFNDMEGMNYLANVKILTSDKYQNMFIQLVTNSTYTQEFEEYIPYDDSMDYLDYVKNALREYLSNLIF